MNSKKIAILEAHALIGWALCGAIVAIGLQLWSMETTMIVHALGVPIIYLVVSGVYFRWFAYTTPLQTALIFLANTVLIDFFVVSLLIQKNLDMFRSPIGTWLPFLLIFLTTYVTGSLVSPISQETAIA